MSLESQDMSDDEPEREEKRSNFRRVASRASNDYRFYRRDLFSLMTLSVQYDERDLALDIGKFFEFKVCSQRSDVVLTNFCFVCSR